MLCWCAGGLYVVHAVAMADAESFAEFHFPGLIKAVQQVHLYQSPCVMTGRPVAGISNIGSTCYFGSCLQLLRSLVDNHPDNLGWGNLLFDGTAHVRAAVRTLLPEQKSDFKSNQQADADACLTALVNCMNHPLVCMGGHMKAQKGTLYTQVSQLTVVHAKASPQDASVQSKVQVWADSLRTGTPSRLCLDSTKIYVDIFKDVHLQPLPACPDTVRGVVHAEQITRLSVPLGSGRCALRDLLETTATGAPDRCGSCRADVTRHRTRLVLRWPPVLIISLQRVGIRTGGSIPECVRTPVDVPYNLSLAPTEQHQTGLVVRPTYRLRSYVCHKGPTPFSGHYWAVVRKFDGQWVTVDDSVVSQTQQSPGGFPCVPDSETVYLMAYERCE